MYYRVVAQCTHSLKTLETCLDKAEQHAAAKKFDVGVLMNSRLAPDMQAFIYQVQSACDYVKAAAAWLSGQTPPNHADNEQTIDELRASIRKTVALAEIVKEPQYAGARERNVRLSWMPGKMIGGDDYLLQVIIPNVFFSPLDGLRHSPPQRCRCRQARLPRSNELRRCALNQGDLTGESWCLPSLENCPWSLIADAFKDRGLDLPRRIVTTRSVQLLTGLVETGQFLAILPGTVLNFRPNGSQLKILPVKLGMRTYPIGIATLRDRTLKPAVQLFIACSQQVIKAQTKVAV